MKAVVQWVRTVASLPLGLFAIDGFHLVAERVVPGAYLPGNDLAFLLLIVAAGIAGCAVAISVTGHRTWVHAGVFLLLMVVVDARTVMGELAGWPVWFRAGVMVSLPLQVWVGMVLVRIGLRYSPGQ